MKSVDALNNKNKQIGGSNIYNEAPAISLMKANSKKYENVEPPTPAPAPSPVKKTVTKES